MANYVIVGAGASGLYTAYRLLSGGTLQSGDTVQLFEWSDRVGGRIYTYTFPPEESWATNGLYVEVGGMRFATDANFPDLANVKEGHVLVQNVICALDLQDKVVPFIESPQRMYGISSRLPTPTSTSTSSHSSRAATLATPSA